jgi:hypothetical protein
MQNKPNFPKHQNNHNLSYRKDLWGFSAFPTPKKQSQSNPISNLPASLLPSIRFLSTALCESGKVNSWQFRPIMIKSFLPFEGNYVLSLINWGCQKRPVLIL